MAWQASDLDSTSENTLRALAKAYMDDDPAHDLAHIQRVVANAKAIARAQPPHTVTPELVAAAWLHDIVAFEGVRQPRMSTPTCVLDASALIALKPLTSGVIVRRVAQRLVAARVQTGGQPTSPAVDR